MQDARIDAVAQIGADQIIENMTANAFFLDREHRLNATIEIPLHQISAAKIEFLVAAVAEIIDPAVFEETPNDAYDADVLTPTLDARSQTADSANDEIDLDSGLRAP